MSNTVPFDKVLRSDLQDREIALGYINALLSEEDEQGVLLALRDIADAMTMGAVAKTAGVNRESLYKMLSGRRDPRFGTVLRVLKALGIKLRALDTRLEIEHSLETAEEAKTREASPKAGGFIGDASRTRPTVYLRHRALTYRAGVCPLDPRKRCLDIVPCAPEGAATEFSEFPLPTWSGMQTFLANDDMVYAG